MPLGVDPYLQETSFSTRMRILSGFLARVRTGYYGQGKQVKNCTVSSALTAVGQTIAMACNDNPTKKGFRQAPPTPSSDAGGILEGGPGNYKEAPCAV
jgi:hypothetical protein